MLPCIGCTRLHTSPTVHVTQGEPIYFPNLITWIDISFCTRGHSIAFHQYDQSTGLHYTYAIAKVMPRLCMAHAEIAPHPLTWNYDPSLGGWQRGVY